MKFLRDLFRKGRPASPPDIGGMKRRSDVNGLIAALAHNDGKVSIAAEEALQDLGGDHVVESLIAVLNRPRASSGPSIKPKPISSWDRACGRTSCEPWNRSVGPKQNKPCAPTGRETRRQLRRPGDRKRTAT